MIEYKENPYSEEQVREFFREFDIVVRDLVRSSERKRGGFFSRLFGKKKKEKQQPDKKEEKLEEKEPEEDEPPEEKPKPEDKEKMQIEEPFEQKTGGATDLGEEPAQQEISIDEELDSFSSAIKEMEYEEKQTAQKKDAKHDIPVQLKENEESPDAWAMDTEEEKAVDAPSELAEDVSKADLDKTIEEVFEKKKGVPEKKKQAKKKPGKKKSLKEMISKAKKEKKVDKLIDIYHEILEVYEEQSGEEQGKYYDEINDLYNRILKEK